MNRQQRRQMERQSRKELRGADAHQRQSTPARPAPSPSRGQQAGNYGLALINSLDGFAPLRGKLAEVADRESSWAGIPMPLEGERLVIEPKFPRAASLAEIGAPAQEPDDPNIKVRNRFYSHKMRCDIYVYEENGRVNWASSPAVHSFTQALRTLSCSDVWGIEQEHRALQLLGTMIRHRQFKQYLLVGMFCETSKRSGLTYFFRKLRPTVVVDTRGKEPRILCTLCMHPIAYYQGSWAGAMCPTDDVIAHLTMLRGDEHLLWRRCNQHEPHRPEAGL